MKAKNENGDVRGASENTLGLLINQALTPESRAFIRDGLPNGRRRIASGKLKKKIRRTDSI